jgi:hypothetical protein
MQLRCLGGTDAARGVRQVSRPPGRPIPWAELLKRTFQTGALKSVAQAQSYEPLRARAPQEAVNTEKAIEGRLREFALPQGPTE